MNLRMPKIEIPDDAMVEMLRQKTPAERLEISDGMWRMARQMIEAMTHREHPEWTDAEVQREVARRMSHGTI